MFTINTIHLFFAVVQKASGWLSNGAFLPQNAASKLVCKYLCGDDANNSELCKKYIVYNIFGEDSEQFDMVFNSSVKFYKYNELSIEYFIFL